MEIHLFPEFGSPERRQSSKLIDLALSEDLAEFGDLTCQALIAETAEHAVDIVARKPGVLAGLPIAEMVFARLDPAVRFDPKCRDGNRLETGTVVATVTGRLRSLLIGERTALNFLTHLCGIATLTCRFVDAVAGTNAVILDTRKTLPGYRVLQKYAVRAGGGTNHRKGLYDGVLIKDNHLAAWAEFAAGATIADAVRRARDVSPAGVSIEVEVDTLDQLRDALAGGPDIVLLDNMDVATLGQAVAIRDALAPPARLEASGGVTLDTVAMIARTGVDRISVGALTHSAVALDLAFDWPKWNGVNSHS